MKILSVVHRPLQPLPRYSKNPPSTAKTPAAKRWLSELKGLLKPGILITFDIVESGFLEKLV